MGARSAGSRGPPAGHRRGPSQSHGEDVARPFPGETAAPGLSLAARNSQSKRVPGPSGSAVSPSRRSPRCEIAGERTCSRTVDHPAGAGPSRL